VNNEKGFATDTARSSLTTHGSAGSGPLVVPEMLEFFQFQPIHGGRSGAAERPEDASWSEATALATSSRPSIEIEIEGMGSSRTRFRR